MFCSNLKAGSFSNSWTTQEKDRGFARHYPVNAALYYVQFIDYTARRLSAVCRMSGYPLVQWLRRVTYKNKAGESRATSIPNSVASNALAQGRPHSVAEYDVAEDHCSVNLLKLVGDLEQHALVRVR